MDAVGRVRLLGEVRLAGPRRALVTVLEEAVSEPADTSLLADWTLPEVDAAWPDEEFANVSLQRALRSSIRK